jgi:hypothetical protein
VHPKNVSVLGRSGDAASESEQRAGDSPAAPEPGRYDEVGGRVAGVLAAAEQAAEQIRADAEREAERVRTEADQYASDVRNAVDSYAQKQRRDAEVDARETLEAAQAEARAMREAAQAMAGQLEAEARRRRAGLSDDTRALEDRRSRALDDLREIAGTLRDLVDGVESAESAPAALPLLRRR